MGRKYKRDPHSKTHLPVDAEIVKKAVLKVKSGMSIRSAAEKFRISKSALQRYVANTDGAIVSTGMKKKGGQTSLSHNFEEELIECILTCCEWGYPMSTFDLRCFVKYHLDREGSKVAKFRDNMPGTDWALSFLSRHSARLSQRMCQNVKRSRAKVSSADIRKYFDELEKTLEGVPPKAIINYDETCLADDPGRRKLIFKRGCKYPERVMNESKSNTSVMFAATADGTLLSPYVIYKAQHLYDLWTEGGPRGARYNRSKSGWIDGCCFLDWFEKIVIPYCRCLVGKKVVIGDNLSSHLSPAVIKLCKENDIALVFLPANSTHMTQPLDLALFRPLKIAWRQVMESWKLKGGGNKPFDKKMFPRLLKQTLDNMQDNMEMNIMSGFKKAGIYPLNRTSVLERLPGCEEVEDTSSDMNVNDSLTSFLKEMRYGGEEGASNLPGRKKRLKVMPGKSVSVEDLTSDDESSSLLPDEEHESELNNSEQGIEEGSWVKVKFLYDRGVEKIFIGKVLKVINPGRNYLGTFLRQSTKVSGIYLFPNVVDEFEFKQTQVMTILKPPVVRRGRYNFNDL